jgi:hypothetical protein
MYTREERRVYMKNFRHRWMLLFKKMLGNKCKKCGSTKDLEFDHVDRKNKKGSISNLLSNSVRSAKYELKLCQLLCKKCHGIKTRKELKNQIPWNKGKTGMYSSDAVEKMRIANVGRVFSKEHRGRLSKSLSGRKLSKSHIENIKKAKEINAKKNMQV